MLIVAGFVVSLSGCKNYSKILKSPDNSLKYNTGIDLYESGNFKKALEFFDLVRSFYQGTKKGEKLTYYTANGYFQIKDYQLAGYYFQQYQQMYPKGAQVEDASYLQAYCSYLQSPRAELDQTMTYTALRELQAFINRYPNSSKVEKAKQLIQALHQKLEQKDYNIALLYYKMEDYDAAITSFQNLLNDYSNSTRRELYMYYIAKSYYTFAANSVPDKQKDRYEKMVEAYNNLLYMYPKSQYLKELKPLSEKAMKHL
ncbi:MAG: outer membrane protein assembly factor BamD [Bacteroidales bacterium]|nr:outer membrane protein assembly factor BamD [Bacteroidales bacterium]